MRQIHTADPVGKASGASTLYSSIVYMHDFLFTGTDWISCMDLPQFPRLPFCVLIYLNLWKVGRNRYRVPPTVPTRGRFRFFYIFTKLFERKTKKCVKKEEQKERRHLRKNKKESEPDKESIYRHCKWNKTTEIGMSRKINEGCGSGPFCSDPDPIGTLAM